MATSELYNFPIWLIAILRRNLRLLLSDDPLGINEYMYSHTQQPDMR